ncbi:acid protease [Exidia glandulosa HHB12029]|uniref:Acid protease n=1 Tax=Exidia glandulosa HHB12029 TaxID=1314781 RepID=A0A165GT48_EXIGL|nr:acid protease [Exidia glandulosa HHB12029]
MPSTTGLSATLLALAAQAAALKIPFTQVVRPHAHSFSASSGAVNALAAPSAPVADVFDNLYLATITLGTQKFNVQLDTGSSDLWVQAGVAASSFNATDLALPAVNITYGSVSGTPATAKFTLGSYVVDEQAFLDVTEADMGSLFAQGANGVLGLSFNSASAVQTAVSAAGSLPASKGQSVLSSLFAQQPAGARDFIAFSLGRVGDLDTTSQGSFSIGEVDAKFAAVNNAPKLSVFANKNAGALQRWTVPVDAIQVAGVTYNVTTAVKNASGKQLALLDTGSSLVLLPQHAITTIYSSIDGAKYDKETDMWFVPCLNQTTVSFVFGGQSFAVHPLDVTHPTQAGLKDGTVVTYCVNTFQVNKDTSEFDVVLGDAFLRNVFAVYDFGDVDAVGKTANPFVKLLSVTDKSSAPADFVQSRKQALETLPPLAPMTEAATFAAVKNFVLQSSVKSSSTEKAASSSAAAPKSTHKTTHKIGFSGKKGKSKTKTTTTTIKKPVIPPWSSGGERHSWGWSVHPGRIPLAQQSCEEA